jgi:hypothetical protein
MDIPVRAVYSSHKDLTHAAHLHLAVRPCNVARHYTLTRQSRSLLHCPRSLFYSPCGLRPATPIHLPQISTNASSPLNEIIDSKHTPTQPFFMQLYVDRNRTKAEQLIAKINDLDLKAIFVTVDCAAPGKREADERSRAEIEMVCFRSYLTFSSSPVFPIHSHLRLGIETLET